MSDRNLLKTGVFLTILLLSTTSLQAAQPNDPSDVQAVPRYTDPISVVVQWQDNSNNEDNFEIHRREEGGAYFFAGSVGAGQEEFEDAMATPDKFWEYRVRARNAAEGNSNWVETDNRTCPKRVWPLEDGDHNILHNFGTPITASSQYWHEGVDISASTKRVVAAHGGVLALVDPVGDKNGGVLIDLDMGPGVIRSDYGYNHLHVDAALVLGETVAPGDLLGTVSDDHFNRATEADHVHWGFTQENTLKYYTGSDADPNNQGPRVADINNDGFDFIVVSATNNDHNSPRNPAWGGVDFLVDAFDDMAANLDLNVAPFSLGYWIQSGVTNGSGVRNAGAPYKLVEFDFPLIPRPNDNGAMYWALNSDMHGINTWQSHLTWIVTNSNATSGAYADIDRNQFWKTDLRTGTATQPNGSDGSTAREIQEAEFPDGNYYVHVVAEDLQHKTDAVREVLVDNFRPYVKKLKVHSGAALVYVSEWKWDASAGQLKISPAQFEDAAVFPASRTRDLTVEIEFSEPMSNAQISSISPLGTTATLTSVQAVHQQTIWKGRISHLDLADNGSDDGRHTISVSGTDLAGNSLLQISDRNAIGSNNNNRDVAGNLRGAAGNDTAHGFVIGGIEGVQTITAVFVKTAGADPPTPAIADKATELREWLNTYYGEIAYNEISFEVTGSGWYPLSHSLNWYYQHPRTPLVDLVQEAVDLADAAGVDLGGSDYILVVTDETSPRDEWSTNGSWPYILDGKVKPMAAGVLNLDSTRARVTHLAGRMLGLIDLFAHPEVTLSRPFVGPWSHMSDKNTEVHFMGWEKWQAGWMDESGHATGVEVERVRKPSIGSPIANRDFTLSPMDEDSDDVKLVAIEIGEGLNYTAEYRRSKGFDAALPDVGVLISKTNDRVAQGEGPVIVSESNITAGDLSDATFTATNPRSNFSDLSSGVQIEVRSMNDDEAQIRLNYAVPPFENDLYVAPHDRWKTVDIWVDAPDLTGAFEADPRTVMNADEKPVVGEVNRVYGRVRNLGAADATNFEVELEILDPWGTDGNWRQLKVDTVPLLEGSASMLNADYIIQADWTPVSNRHACVKLRVRGAANDINEANNETQENINEFVSVPGSPYEPVISRFQVKNTFNEKLPFFFRVDGLPEGWNCLINPKRPYIDPGDTITAQVILQPEDAAPLCSREEITLQVFAPRVDTLKSAGGITLSVSLKNGAEITHESWTDCDCYCPDGQTERCGIYTRGCTDPGTPNTRLAIVYTTPDGESLVRYVNTDEDGCFTDILQAEAQEGRWETTVVMDETECRIGARSGPYVIVVAISQPDECSEYRKELMELTQALMEAMEKGEESVVKEIYNRIQKVMRSALQCDPAFEEIIQLYKEMLKSFYSGRMDIVGELYKEITNRLN